MDQSLVINKVNIPHKKDILMEKLSVFYQNVNNLNCILPIVNGKSKISLRIIDWFVTNFSKKNNTRITKINNEQFIVYINYKAQLKAYTKKQFDPFCRRERIRFFYKKDDFLITTVGQLNFFRWAIENGVIDYISDNIKIIESDMNNSVKKSKIENIEDTISIVSRKKRQELSISATKTLNKHNISITVSFE